MSPYGNHCAPTATPLRCDDLLGELREIGDEAAEFFENAFDQLERAWLRSSATESRQRTEGSQWERKWTSQFDNMRALLEDLSRRLPGNESAAPARPVANAVAAFPVESMSESPVAASKSGVQPMLGEPGAFRPNRRQCR